MPDCFSIEDLDAIRFTLPTLAEGVSTQDVDKLLEAWHRKFGCVWADKDKKEQRFREQCARELSLLQPLAKALAGARAATEAAMNDPDAASTLLDGLALEEHGLRMAKGYPTLRRRQSPDGPVAVELRRILTGLAALSETTDQALKVLMNIKSKKGQRARKGVDLAITNLAYIFAGITGSRPTVNKRDGGRAGDWTAFVHESTARAWKGCSSLDGHINRCGSHVGMQMKAFGAEFNARDIARQMLA